MSVYLADNIKDLKTCIETNRIGLALLGITLSLVKTLFFKRGVGEYTSWYMDQQFVAQYGVETASIRPYGKNPHDDFYAVAKGTSTALGTLTMSPLGASARLRLGIDGVRRLWRIIRDPHKRLNVKDNVLFLSDGGKCLWHCMNSQLDETAMREANMTTDTEKEYFARVINPDNPFSGEPMEEMTFCKETGSLQLEMTETPRNIFCHVNRSNRTFRTALKKDIAEKEKEYGEALKIVRSVDPVTNIVYPRSNVTISDQLMANLDFQRQKFQLTNEEESLYQSALRYLTTGMPEEHVM